MTIIADLAATSSGSDQRARVGIGVSGGGPRLCENSKTLNRDRTSYSFEIVFGAHIASPFDFEIELKNIILVALRVFEFSHSLGPYRRKPGFVHLSAVRGRPGNSRGAAKSMLMTQDLPSWVTVSAALRRIGSRVHQSMGDERAAPDLLQCIAVDGQSGERAFDAATGFGALVGGRTDTCSAVAIPAPALSGLADRMRISPVT